MLLALETSDRLCAACLYDEAAGAVVASRTLDIERGHAERMIGLIGEILAEAGASYAALTGLAVCTGPGSFTGIRVALATATGLSIALSIPITGVTALQALAFAAMPQAVGRKIAVLIDAHRGDVYLQAFAADGLPLDAASQLPVAAAAHIVAADAHVLSGSGAALVQGALPDHAASVVQGSVLPSVDAVAACAARPQMTVAAQPLYLRRPDARPQQAYVDARALRS